MSYRRSVPRTLWRAAETTATRLWQATSLAGRDGHHPTDACVSLIALRRAIARRIVGVHDASGSAASYARARHRSDRRRHPRIGMTVDTDGPPGVARCRDGCALRSASRARALVCWLFIRTLDPSNASAPTMLCSMASKSPRRDCLYARPRSTAAAQNRLNTWVPDVPRRVGQSPAIERLARAPYTAPLTHLAGG